MSCTRECSGICIVTFSKCHKKRENFPTTATSPVQALRPAPQQQSQNQHHAQQQVAVTGQPTQPAPQRLRFSAAFSSPGEKKTPDSDRKISSCLTQVSHASKTRARARAKLTGFLQDRGDESYRLHGLPQAHIVSEDAAMPSPKLGVEPLHL